MRNYGRIKLINHQSYNINLWLEQICWALSSCCLDHIEISYYEICFLSFMQKFQKFCIWKWIGTIHQSADRFYQIKLILLWRLGKIWLSNKLPTDCIQGWESWKCDYFNWTSWSCLEINPGRWILCQLTPFLNKKVQKQPQN